MKNSALRVISENKKLLGLLGLYVIALGAISYQITFALFTAHATSTNNSFTAASEFPLTAPGGSVVINEIMWMGSTGHTGDEWIELRNMTNNTYDMTGWQLIGAGNTDITIPSGTLSAHGYFLVANNVETDVATILNVHPDYQTTAVQIDNNNFQVFLANQAHDIVDIADDNTSLPMAGSIGTPKKSMERNDPPGNGMDPAKWHDATTQVNLDGSATDLATPKAPNVP